MKTSDFDYDLPPEYIAQAPVEPRDSSKLLVLDRKSGLIEHAIFSALPRFLLPGDLLVWNETRVIPARLYGRKLHTGGRVELFLIKRLDHLEWEAIVGGKGLGVGRLIQVENGPQAQVLAVLDGGLRRVRFDQPIEMFLSSAGHTPLPPYIHAALQDPERYQTVYAHLPGSVAAPTAGLHFTPGLIADLRQQGIRIASVALHIGLDTFAPVKEAYAAEHRIHSEWCQLSAAAAELINQTKARGGRVIAVGTTSVRTLESASRGAPPGQAVLPFEGLTDLFILPGYQFRVVDALITNFHLPRSTLIMLVSAFASRELILQSYEAAKEHGYRFYSFGDAMFII